MIQIWAVYLRGILIIKKRLIKTLAGMLVSPLLYAVAFGWGIGRDITVEGVSYLQFMLPGLIAISTMNQSFNVSYEINIIRFFSKVFEEFLLSPASSFKIVLGNVLYGMTKGMLSFIILVCIAAFAGKTFSFNPLILLPVLLNVFMFASLGVFISLAVKTHRDMSNFMSFVITPMSFLAGTFFSLNKLPILLQYLARIIPLTHASIAIRGAYLGYSVSMYHYLALAGYSAVFFLLAVYIVKKAVD